MRRGRSFIEGELRHRSRWATAPMICTTTIAGVQPSRHGSGIGPRGRMCVMSSFASARTNLPLETNGARSEVGHRPVAAWLFVCCALVFAMIVVGGVTRLTHSGLSIVEWQPIVGTLPPLTDAQWQETFAKYQLTPEFRQVNHANDARGVQGHLLVGILPPAARPRDRRRVPRAACSGSPRAGAFPRATAGSWPASSCWAGCRARWAGTWCRAGSSTIRASRSSG